MAYELLDPKHAWLDEHSVLSSNSNFGWDESAMTDYLVTYRTLSPDIADTYMCGRNLSYFLLM